MPETKLSPHPFRQFQYPTLPSLVNSKELDGTRIGRSFRVRTDEVERYLRDH